MNRQELQAKLGSVTSRLLREKGHISYPDLFIALGYLDRRDYEDWRLRRVPRRPAIKRRGAVRIYTDIPFAPASGWGNKKYALN